VAATGEVVKEAADSCAWQQCTVGEGSSELMRRPQNESFVANGSAADVERRPTESNL
jgi:hypothetical protein